MQLLDNPNVQPACVKDPDRVRVRAFLVAKEGLEVRVRRITLGFAPHPPAVNVFHADGAGVSKPGGRALRVADAAAKIRVALLTVWVAQ